MKARRKALAPNRDSVQSRRRIGLKLTVASAAVAMFASGLGMWKFIDDLPGMDHFYVILPMFLLFDLAAVACAWNARINRLAYGRMGTEGWLVWLFAILSGLMSASDATGMGALYRFSAPIVAAILFELLIRGERHDLTNTDGPMARIRRRTLARFGLLDDVDQDDEEAARTRMAARLATAAYRVHETVPGTRSRRAAVRRYHRRLRTASVRMGFATNDEMIEEVRLHLDALYSSITGTAPGAVADLNVWQSAGLVDHPDDDEAVVEEPPAVEVRAPAELIVRPARIGPSRRPRRSGRLAGRLRTRKAPQATAEPVLEPLAPGSTARQLGAAAYPDWEIIETRQEPPLQPPVDEAPQPVAASAADVKRPQTVTQPTRPRSRVASRSRKAKASPEDLQAAARSYWETEQAAGRSPSHRQIAAAVGASKSSVSRWAPNWTTLGQPS